ncbi:hypothetical protein ACFLQN_03025 [Candidatus Aenigmatarchaeota archaeon]
MSFMQRAATALREDRFLIELRADLAPYITQESFSSTEECGPTYSVLIPATGDGKNLKAIHSATTLSEMHDIPIGQFLHYPTHDVNGQTCTGMDYYF